VFGDHSRPTHLLFDEGARSTEEKQDEENQEGNARGKPDQARMRRRQLVRIGLEYPDDKSPEVDHRQVLEPSNGGSAVGEDDKKGERQGVESQARDDEYPGRRRKAEPDNP
jgi:hypothetical protein